MHRSPTPRGTRHRADAGTRRPQYAPVIVADMAAHDDAITRFLSEDSRAESTREGDAKRWPQWVRHCAVLGVDPLAAPYEAFVSLFELLRADGRPLAAGTVRVMAATILHEYTTRGLLPAHKRPENSADWTQRMKGAARRDAQLREAGSPPQPEPDPLTREVMTALFSAQPVSGPGRYTDEAILLLALDQEVSIQEAASALLGAVSPDPDWRPVMLPTMCDHEERVAGVPWDCTACAIHRAVAALVDERLNGSAELETIVRSAAARAGARLSQMAHHLERGAATLTEPVTMRADVDVWAMGGLRRALVLLSRSPAGLRWLRARAWVGASWACGIRMCSGMARMSRSDVVIQGESVLITVSQELARGQYRGESPGRRRMLMSRSRELSVPASVSEYACVRDAVVGSDGAFIVPIASNGRFVPGLVRKTVHVANGDLRLLCEIAKVSGRYVSSSTWRGYAQQADLDGWRLEDIQDGLGHVEIQSTAEAALGGEGRRAVRKLMRRGDAR